MEITETSEEARIQSLEGKEGKKIQDQGRTLFLRWTRDLIKCYAIKMKLLTWKGERESLVQKGPK